MISMSGTDARLWSMRNLERGDWVRRAVAGEVPLMGMAVVFAVSCSSWMRDIARIKGDLRVPVVSSEGFTGTLPFTASGSPINLMPFVGGYDIVGLSGTPRASPCRNNVSDQRNYAN
jgi:hypothetical protein